MPFLAPFVPAIIGAGTAIYSSSQQKKGAKQVLQAQTQGNDKALAEQTAARNQSLQVNQPYLTGGAQGWDMLLRELNVTPPAPARPQTNARPSQPAPQRNYGTPQGGQPSNPQAMTVGPQGGGQPRGPMLASGGPGWKPPTSTDMQPPGPAPAGKRWVHGPEGYALMDERTGTTTDPMSALRAFGGGKEGPARDRSGLDAARNYGTEGGGYSGQPTNPYFAEGGGGTFNGGMDDTGGGGQEASGGPDYQGYLQANGDLASSGWLDQHRGEWGDLTGDGQVDDQDTAAKHYELHGKGEGRQLSQRPGNPSGPQQQQQSGPPDLMNAERPQAGPAPSYQRPGDVAPPTYNRQPNAPAPTFQAPNTAPAPSFTRQQGPAAPQFQRPDQPQFNDSGPAPEWGKYFDPNNIQADPSYQFRLNKGLENVNSSFGARGMLRSGAALKGFSDYAQDSASQEFGNIFSRAMSRYQTDLGQYNTSRAQNFNMFDRNRTVTNTNAETDYNLNTDAHRWNTNRNDVNFNTDRTADTDDWRFGVNRGDRLANEDYSRRDSRSRYDEGRQDTNFASDRSYGTNLWKEQQDRRDGNFEVDRAYGTDAHRWDTNRNDANFDRDRSYQTSRYDTRIGNLFDVAQIGVDAAGQASGVNQDYARNAGNIYGSQANAAADAAASRAGANANLGQAVGGVVRNVYANYGNTPGPTPIGHVEPVTSGAWKLPDYNSLTRPPSSVKF